MIVSLSGKAIAANTEIFVKTDEVFKNQKKSSNTDILNSFYALDIENNYFSN